LGITPWGYEHAWKWSKAPRILNVQVTPVSDKKLRHLYTGHTGWAKKTYLEIMAKRKIPDLHVDRIFLPSLRTVTEPTELWWLFMLQVALHTFMTHMTA
jgi:hypothetical protein